MTAIKKNPPAVMANYPRLGVLAAAIATGLACPTVYANPDGAAVVSGSASFVTAGDTLTIHNSPGAIIDWQSFSINKGELTQFIQQNAASAVLNRVTGGDPSQILGALQSNGRVFLINPNGITFGSEATVDVAGLVVSTLNLSNEHFLAGHLKFEDQAHAGGIVNQGKISTAAGGQVLIVAPKVENSGIITAANGDIILAAGHSVSLIDPDKPEISVELSAKANQAINLGQLVAKNISVYSGLVSNAGTISADTAIVGQNGRIILDAQESLATSASSSISSNGPSGGTVVLASQGNTQIDGKIEANAISVVATESANEPDLGKGGVIAVLGDTIGLMENARISASGAKGGGVVLVGGDAHGQPSQRLAKLTDALPFSSHATPLTPEPSPNTARMTWMSDKASIHVDAEQLGNGGDLVLWADDAARVYGQLSATGGRLAGDGGFVETSGKRFLDVSVTPDLSAVNGRGGTWLLDPNDVLIQSALPDRNTTSAPNFDSVNDSAVIRTSTIEAALNSGTNVRITTGNGGTNSQAGDITIDDPLSKTGSASATLTLSAHRNININADISAISGILNLSLTANSDGLNGGLSSIGSGRALNLNGGTLTFANGLNLDGSLRNSSLVSADNSIFTGSSGILDRVAINSNLIANGSFSIANGLALANGIEVQVGNSRLLFNGGALTSAGQAEIRLSGAILSGSDLTIGSGVTVSGYGQVDATGVEPATLTNNGALVSDTNGRTLAVGAGAGFAQFTNTGAIRVNAGSFNIHSGTTWRNDGLFVLTGGTLNLGGDFSTVGIGTLSRSGGIINLTQGTLDNRGSSLDLDRFGRFGPGGLGSINATRILGGTLLSDASFGLNGSGSLDGVTIGNASHSQFSTDGSFTVVNGLNLASGLVLQAGDSQWSLESGNIDSLGPASIRLAGATLTNAHSNTPLIIGNGITINGYGQIISNSAALHTLINNGVLVSDTTGQSLAIGDSSSASAFVNNGTIQVNAGSFDINEGISWQNAGQIQLNAGTLNLGGNFNSAGIGTLSRQTGSIINLTRGTFDANGSVLNIGLTGTFGAGGLGTINATRLLADAIVSDGSARLVDVTIGDSANTQLNLEGTFYFVNNLTLADGASLYVGDSRWLVSGGNINSPGKADIILAGGALTDTSTGAPMLIGSGISISGFGSVNTQDPSNPDQTIVNNGTITADSAGNTLEIEAFSFVNNGLMRVAAGILSVNQTGSDWRNDGALEILSSGTLSIANGNLINGPSGTIRGTGIIDLESRELVVNGNPIRIANTLVNDGSMTPGVDNTVGTLRVFGSLVNNGLISIPLWGKTPGSYGSIALQDDPALSVGQQANATLGGSLEITEGNQFFADLGDNFNNIITASGDISGSFVNLVQPNDVVFLVSTSGAVSLMDTSESITRWQGYVDSEWATAANWTRGTPNLNKDAVIAGLAANQTINVSYGSQTAHDLQIDDNFTLQLNGGILSLPVGFNQLASDLVIDGGILIAQSPLILSGTVNILDGIIVGPNLINSGRLFVYGDSRFNVPVINTGLWNFSSGVTSFSSVFTQSAGVVQLAGGDMQGDYLLENGSLTGNGTITGNLDVLAGSLSPGGPIGVMTITGNLALSETSSLFIDLGGLTQGVEYDYINVLGTSNLAGELSVGANGDYEPAIGSKYNFMNFATSAGQFTQVSQPWINMSYNAFSNYLELQMAEFSLPSPIELIPDPIAPFPAPIPPSSGPIAAVIDPIPLLNKVPSLDLEIIIQGGIKNPVIVANTPMMSAAVGPVLQRISDTDQPIFYERKPVSDSGSCR